MGDTSTGSDERIPALAEAGGSMPQMMTPMREMPAPRLHAGMMPATFVPSGLVTTAAFMMAASGDDGMNRIDDAARRCRTLRPAACIIAATHAAAHAATFMAAHSAGMTTAAAARKCTVRRNHHDAQGTGKCQHREHCARKDRDKFISNSMFLQASCKSSFQSDFARSPELHTGDQGRQAFIPAHHPKLGRRRQSSDPPRWIARGAVQFAIREVVLRERFDPVFVASECRGNPAVEKTSGQPAIEAQAQSHAGEKFRRDGTEDPEHKHVRCDGHGDGDESRQIASLHPRSPRTSRGVNP
jgi:hypothetical protein